MFVRDARVVHPHSSAGEPHRHTSNEGCVRGEPAVRDTSTGDAGRFQGDGWKVFLTTTAYARLP
jgi:hypothetical protein